MRLFSIACWLSLGVVVATAAPQTPAARAPRNAAEFDDLFQRVKNWGRWGTDDQLGSANLVTAAKRKQAASLVKSGTSVSLAHNPLTERAEDNASPFEHTMNRGFAMDTYRVSCHGYAHSHIDALCHFSYNQDLEAVAETAAKLNRWELMLTIAPVPVTGGTGFPLNELAAF